MKTHTEATYKDQQHNYQIFSQNYSQRSDGNLPKFGTIADIFLEYVETFKNKYFEEDLWMTNSVTANWS